MNPGANVDVSELLDQQRVGSFQIRVLILCGLGVLLDGFSTQAMGYVAPAVVRDMHLGTAAISPVFAWGLIGIMVGTLALGPVGDRFGRRKIIIFCTAFFGVVSAATAMANSLDALVILRFIAGIGLGGVMPNAISLTAEFSPRRSRATMVMVMFCGFPIGAMIGGFAAAPLISASGWRAVFWLAGILPLVLVPVLFWMLPESIRHLLLHGGKSGEIAALLRRLNPALALGQDTRFVTSEERTTGIGVGRLFGQGRGLLTVLLWLVFFSSLLDLYLLASWLPTVFHAAGMELSLSIIATALFQGGGVAGSVILGGFVDRFGAYRVLALTYLLGAVSIALLGPARSVGAIMACAFCAGIGIIGGQMGANLIAASIYPTSVRSTGVGWALGIGRIGSVIGPIVGGMMLSRHWPLSTIFLAAAIPAVLGFAAIYVMGQIQHPRKGMAATGPAVP